MSEGLILLECPKCKQQMFAERQPEEGDHASKDLATWVSFDKSCPHAHMSSMNACDRGHPHDTRRR